MCWNIIFWGIIIALIVIFLYFVFCHMYNGMTCYAGTSQHNNVFHDVLKRQRLHKWLSGN